MCAVTRDPASSAMLTPSRIPEEPTPLFRCFIRSMCDRLIEKGLVRRDPADRGVSLRLAEAGRKLVRNVSEARRAELQAIVAQMSESERQELVRCMEAFHRAAGEPGGRDWAFGWWD